MQSNLSKKVLFLTSWYPSEENLTLGNFVQKHAEIAHEVADISVLYAISKNEIVDVEIDRKVINGVDTCVVYYPKINSNFPLISNLSKRKAYLSALQRGFEELNQEFDYIHLNAVFPAGMYALKLKRPYYVTVHWTGFLDNNSGYSNLSFPIKLVFKKILKNASKVLPVSEHLGKSLKKLSLISDYEVLNNVVDEKVFYPVEEKNTDVPVRFIHISTFVEEHKNISGILSSFGKLERDFTLHLITENSEDEVWAEIDRYGVPREKCIVESKLSTEDIADRIRKADCLVLFSNYETFSVVLAEAWMSGVPAIYSQCGGLTEINNPVLGRQIQAKDEEQLLNEIQNFARSQYAQDKIREFALTFSRSNVKKTFAELYK